MRTRRAEVADADQAVIVRFRLGMSSVSIGRTDPQAQELRTPSLYDDDFYSWTHQQARLLRDGRFQDVDIEEIETLGRSKGSSLRSSLRLILMHLLRMAHQPGKITPS